VFHSGVVLWATIPRCSRLLRRFSLALADAVAEFLQRGRFGLTAFDALTRVSRTGRQNVLT
jgi:hypothetical protein